VRRKGWPKSSANKLIISASSIIIFSFMGISYASWDSVLNLKAKVSTAELDIDFANPEADSWSAVIANSTINDYIINCEKLEVESTESNDNLYLDGFNIDTSNPVYVLFRLDNDGTLPLRLDESSLSINGITPSFGAPVAVNNIITGDSSISTILGNVVCNNIDGVEVILYYPKQDIVPREEQFQGWGLIILKAINEGQYCVKIDLPFIQSNNPSYMTSWKEKLNINMNFRVIPTINSLSSESDAEMSIDTSTSSTGSEIIEVSPEPSPTEAIDGTLEDTLPDDIEIIIIEPTVSNDNIIDTAVSISPESNEINSADTSVSSDDSTLEIAVDALPASYESP